MADHAHPADAPPMDYIEHERTYVGFVHIAEVATTVSLAIVAALAVGGVKHAWGTALIGTLLAVIAAGLGIASDKISWRAPVVVLVLMLLALLLY
ncbi:aa3-type cytochrome c oxidase subunit IV [Bosea sp. AS-1]|uniref:aa3-type cytochrome c oxidase subunit IV n=1 Tax=Bosea sp. AS-1 TaxID=2015316 RepID=UPI000B77D2F0|nr:aa3-type cytochrome c oxidase subunit IV [Bosea sp. AS-1]